MFSPSAFLLGERLLTLLLVFVAAHFVVVTVAIRRIAYNFAFSAYNRLKYSNHPILPHTIEAVASKPATSYPVHPEAKFYDFGFKSSTSK